MQEAKLKPALSRVLTPSRQRVYSCFRQTKTMQSITPKSNFTQLDWYLPLVEEIHDTIKMAVIESRIRLVEGYWSVGKLIRTASKESDVTDLVHSLAGDADISERTLWYALKAYDTYPEFSKIPEGNNISWNKMITKYLTDPKDPEPCEHEPITICKKCKLVIIENA